MRKRIRKSYLMFAVCALALPLLFNACGGPNGFHSLEGSGNYSSVASVQKKICESELIAVYANTYHPLMKSNCNFCHSSSHGSNDLRVSFSAFHGKGQAMIDSRSSTPHGGNSINISSQIAAVHQTYADANTAYQNCMAANPGEEVTLPFNITEKALTGVSGSFREFAWDLNLDSVDRAQEVKATFRIEAKLYTNQGAVVGLEFKNPSIQLASGQSPIRVEGLRFIVNGQMQDSTTTYSHIAIDLSGTTKTNLAQGLGSAFVYLAGASATTPVGFQFLHLK